MMIRYELNLLILVNLVCTGSSFSSQAQLPTVVRKRYHMTPLSSATISDSSSTSNYVNGTDTNGNDSSSSLSLENQTVQQQQQQQQMNIHQTNSTEEEQLGFSILSLPMENTEVVPFERPKDAEEEGEEESKKYASQAFVRMFRESANYISIHRGTTVVIHIPIELIDDSRFISGELVQCDEVECKPLSAFQNLIDDVALLWLLGMKLVIVLGIRGMVNNRIMLESKSIPNTYNGIRVTDESTMRLLKEEAGYARFEVERQLARAMRDKQGNTIGNNNIYKGQGNVVSGNFFSAQPVGVRDGIDFEYTGLVRNVDTDRIEQAHKNQDVVVMTSLGVSPSGELFSVKSESLTATVASKLKAAKIMYVLKRSAHAREKDTEIPFMSMRLADAKALLNAYNVKVTLDGQYTVPEFQKYQPAVNEYLEKLGFCTAALSTGNVKRAHMIDPSDGSLLEELFTRDNGTGTMISRDLYDGIRRARVEDVPGISSLIKPLVEAGTLVSRPDDVLEREIHTYFVYTRDDAVLACGQLKRFEGGFAEIGCLVVDKDYRRSGKGDAMLSYLERIGLKSGATKLFVLSTQTMAWFIERGFKPVDVNDLPLSRRKTYNTARKSKIYMKSISGTRELDAEELKWDNA